MIGEKKVKKVIEEIAIKVAIAVYFQPRHGGQAHISGWVRYIKYVYYDSRRAGIASCPLLYS